LTHQTITTLNLTIIIPTYINLAGLKPYPNLTAARILMMIMKWLSCEGCENEFSYPWLWW